MGTGTGRSGAASCCTGARLVPCGMNRARRCIWPGAAWELEKAGRRHAECLSQQRNRSVTPIGAMFKAADGLHTHPCTLGQGVLGEAQAFAQRDQLGDWHAIGPTRYRWLEAHGYFETWRRGEARNTRDNRWRRAKGGTQGNEPLQLVPLLVRSISYIIHPCQIFKNRSSCPL